jgi:DNA-damage-inducible protein J
MMTLVQAQVEDAVRSEVEKVLSHEGMSLTEAFRVFLERTAQEGAIPTEVFRPNAETVAAMEAVRRGETFRVSSIRELMDEIDAEDESA